MKKLSFLLISALIILAVTVAPIENSFQHPPAENVALAQSKSTDDQFQFAILGDTQDFKFDNPQDPLKKAEVIIMYKCFGAGV